MTLTDEVQKLAGDMPRIEATVLRHEEQLNGPRGQSTALMELASEIKALRRAAYWVAGIIVAGSITFAFSAVSLLGGGGGP